jgi:hypothetical protein
MAHDLTHLHRIHQRLAHGAERRGRVIKLLSMCCGADRRGDPAVDKRRLRGGDRLRRQVESLARAAGAGLVTGGFKSTATLIVKFLSVPKITYEARATY